jgi:hypothetical protein
MLTGDIIGFIGLGIIVLGGIIRNEKTSSKNSQKLDDLCVHVNKQNGRVDKLETGETECSKAMEHRLTKVETNLINTDSRVDKIEAIPYVEKRVQPG